MVGPRRNRDRLHLARTAHPRRRRLAEAPVVVMFRKLTARPGRPRRQDLTSGGDGELKPSITRRPCFSSTIRFITRW
jgi:hypothetical protein